MTGGTGAGAAGGGAPCGASLLAGGVWFGAGAWPVAGAAQASAAHRAAADARNPVLCFIPNPVFVVISGAQMKLSGLCGASQSPGIERICGLAIVGPIRGDGCGR